MSVKKKLGISRPVAQQDELSPQAGTDGCALPETEQTGVFSCAGHAYPSASGHRVHKG